MNSPFANIYLELIERLRTEVPELRYVNQDIGQLENYGDRPPVTFPCLLIDFQDFEYSDMGERVQIGQGQITMRLAHAPFSDSSNLTSDMVREKALAYYETEYKVNTALHGWQGEAMGYLTRASTTTEAREDNLRVRAIAYKVKFEDTSASPNYVAIPDGTDVVLKDKNDHIIATLTT